jgi:hypothetical protein
MTTPSAPPRFLILLAGVLAVAIAALCVAWLRLEPTLPDDPTPAPAPHGDAAAAVPATAHGDADAPRDAAPAVARSGAAAEPAATAVLFGTVKRADGTPVTGGYCWLSRDGKQVGMASLGRSAFAFPGLQPGMHRLTSRIPDELAIDREIAVVAPQTRVDIEFAAKWLLTVNAVTAEGKPLREAVPGFGGFGLRSLRALAFAEALAGDLVSSRSSELDAGLGPFRANDPIRAREEGQPLPKETLGVLTLPPDRPVHVALLLGSTLIAQQAASPGQEKVDFVLAPEAILDKASTVTFRCVDPDGAPVAGARVSISGGSGVTTGQKMVTDAEGRYTANNVLPGRVGFGVWHKELLMPPLQAEVAPGASVDLGDLTMRAAVELEISFAGSGGSGSARLYWLDVPHEPRWTSPEQYFSEQNGATAKTLLFPGRYLLIARGKNTVALVEIDTNALPLQPLRMPWTASATLRIDSQAVTTYVQYEIATVGGLPVCRGEMGNHGGNTIGLPPGDYVATIRGSGGSVTRKTVALPPGGAVLTLP